MIYKILWFVLALVSMLGTLVCVEVTLSSDVDFWANVVGAIGTALFVSTAIYSFGKAMGLDA